MTATSIIVGAGVAGGTLHLPLEEWWDRAVAAWPDYAEYQRKTDRRIELFVLEPVS